MNNDLISRQAATLALKAKAVPLYKDPECNDIWERDRTLDNAIDVIRGLPSVDAVEVVRCKDCEYFSEPNSFSGKCTLRGDYIFTNDFCSYAVERKTDE